MTLRQLIEDYFLNFYFSLTNTFGKTISKKTCYLILAIICGVLLGIILAAFLSLGRITQIIAIVLFILMFLGHVAAAITRFIYRKNQGNNKSQYLIYYTASFLIHQGAVIIGIITWSLIISKKGHCTYSNNDTSDTCFLTSVMFLFGSVFFFFGAVYEPIIRYQTENQVQRGIDEMKRQENENQLNNASPVRNDEPEYRSDLRSKEDNSEATSIDDRYLEAEHSAPLPPYDLVCNPEDGSTPPYIL